MTDERGKDVAMQCSVCGKRANPAYMCDKDEFDNKYCTSCFAKTGCEQTHEEDCMTTVTDDGPTPQRPEPSADLRERARLSPMGHIDCEPIHAVCLNLAAAIRSQKG